MNVDMDIEDDIEDDVDQMRAAASSKNSQVKDVGASKPATLFAESAAFMPSKVGHLQVATGGKVGTQQQRQIQRHLYLDGRVYEGEVGAGGHIKDGNGKFTWANGGVFTGEFCKGRIHGAGKMTTRKGETYEGKWQNGRMHGFGVKTYSDGRVYEGMFKEGMACGRGVLRDATGSVYEGEFEGNLRHGQGTETYSDGSRYEGSYKQGMACGFGRKLECDGRVYEGEWAGGKRTGKGKQTWLDGRIYEGQWKSNQQKGFGVEIKPNGAKYEGGWKCGLKEGKGTSLDADRRYTGEWKRGCRCGEGTLIVEGGLTYTGTWLNDKYHGHGIEILGSGGRYEGQWKDGRQDGQGEVNYSDGMKYSGGWRDGLFDGTGALQWPDGHRYEGNFVKHKLSGEGVCIWPGGRRFVGRLRDDRPLDGEMWELDGTINQVVCDGKKSFWLGQEPIIKVCKLLSTAEARSLQAGRDEDMRRRLLEMPPEALEMPGVDWDYMERCTGEFSRNDHGWEGPGKLFRAKANDEHFVVRVMPSCDQVLAAFRRELMGLASALAAGNHPNIATLGGVSRAKDPEGSFVVVYRFEMTSLLPQHISENSSHEFASALGWKLRHIVMAGVCSGLVFLKDKAGLLHGRVTRSAVCLGRSFRPILFDFNRCVSLVQQQCAEENLQTPNSNSVEYFDCPRFIKSGIYTEQSEVYSAGVMFLEILTGRLSSVKNDLVHHFVEDEEGDLEKSLDCRAGSWDSTYSELVCRLVSRCVGPPKHRPSLVDLERSMMELIKCLDWKHQDEQDCLLRSKEILQQSQDEWAAAPSTQPESSPVHLQDFQVPHSQPRQNSTCVVCFDDDVQSKRSVVCNGRVDQHVVCLDCFQGLVLSASRADQASLLSRNAKVFCPMVVTGECTSEPYGDQEIALRVGKQVLDAYMNAQKRLIEQRVVDELKGEITLRMRMDICHGRIDRLRRHIADRILTLRCPNRECEQAFFDFDACFALSCGKCNHIFCGYCLKLFAPTQGDIAHTHVVRCPYNLSSDKGLFADQALFFKAQKRRRERLLREFLFKQDGHVRNALLDACEKEIEDVLGHDFVKVLRGVQA